MSSRDEQSASNVQYEPDENPPALVSLGSGLQLVVLGITSIIFIPTVVIRVSGGTELTCPGPCSVQSPSVESARLCKRSG